MNINEKYLREHLNKNLKELGDSIHKGDKANAIVKALNYLDNSREWVSVINRDEIVSMITNSKDNNSLIESIVSKVCPISTNVKRLNENKKKSIKKVLKESVDKKSLKEDYSPVEQEVINILKGFGWLDEKNGYFEYTVYPDYHDHISLRELNNILKDNDINSVDDFIMWIDESYDYYSYDYDEIENQVFEQLDKKNVEYDSQEVSDFIHDKVAISVDYNFWLNDEYLCHIFVDTGDGNYDFSLNPCYSTDYTFELDDEDTINHASLIWVAQQQGYSPEQLKSALDGEQTDSKFLKSAVNEVANAGSSLNTFAICCKATLGEVLNWNSNPTTITVNNCKSCGLFDVINGGGSILDIELEKALVIPAQYVGEFWFDIKPKNYWGYSIDDVYGMTSGAYDADIKIGGQVQESLNKETKKSLKEDLNKKQSKKLNESEEIDRQLFVSLVRLGDNAYDGYSILRDGNFVKRIYAENDEDAKKQFRQYISKKESLLTRRFNKTLKEELGKDEFILNTSNTPILDAGLYYTFLGELSPGRGTNPERFKEFEQTVMDNAEPILDELIKQTDGFELVSVDEYYHPKYYNYDTDDLTFKIRYTKDDLGDVIEQYSNNPEFIEFLKNYKSYDGFISFYASNKEDFITQSPAKSISQILKFNVSQDDYEKANEELYYAVMDDGFYPEDEMEEYDENLKEDNNALARKMGAKFLPPKDYGVKKKKPRYVYELYYFDTPDCSGDAIYRRFSSRKAQQDWYEKHKNDPDKFDMYVWDEASIEEELKENVNVNHKKVIKEGYYDYMDKDYAEILDSNVDVYDVKQFVLDESNNEFTTHYSDEYAIIVCANGKGCVVDYEAVGQDFDSVDSKIEFGIVKNENDEYTDEQGVTHRTISLIATHKCKTTPREVMEKAPKKTMKYRDFFTKYKYNDRCAYNFKDLVAYITKNDDLSKYNDVLDDAEKNEGCHSKKKGKKLKEGYLGQTLYDFFDDCIEPENIEKVTLWGEEDIVYEGDYEGAMDDFSDNEFIEFDCGTDKVTIKVDSSEEYQVTTYFVDVQDFLECYNGDDIEVYDIANGETLFSGDKYDCPDEVLEKIFVSFDAPNYISINIEEYDDEDDNDDFDESLKEGADGNTILSKVIEYKKQGLKKEEIVDKVSKELDVEKDSIAQYFNDLKEEIEYIDGSTSKLYCIYQNAVDEAKRLGLKESEYGDVYGQDFSYACWNKTGDRNDVEEIVCYYFFDENGKPKKSISAVEFETIKREKDFRTADFDDPNLEDILDEGLNERKQLSNKQIDALVRRNQRYLDWQRDYRKSEDDNSFKFKEGDNAYTIVASFDNGEKHIYEPVTIDKCWKDVKFGNQYSFIRNNGSKVSSCPEEFLLTKSELDDKLKQGSKLVEDTVKQNGKWVNKGDTGKTHGTFKTKKEADAQRKAMFVNKKPNTKWGK